MFVIGILSLLITFDVISIAKATQGNEFYITPSNNIKCTCLSAPCHTFNSYAENHNFTSNTLFTFMPGTHHLETNFILDGLLNVTLRGSHDLSSRVLVNSSNVTITSTEMVTIQNLVFESLANSTAMIAVSKSDDVTFLNVHFHGSIGVEVSAISAMNSDLSFTNTLFTGCKCHMGGAIVAKNSNLSFTGNSTFSRNTALAAGGAMYVESCNVNFHGQTTFLENSARLGVGGAMLARNSSVVLSGFSIFNRNSASSSASEGEASIRGGGALAMIDSKLWLNDQTRFLSNTSPNGGAVLAHGSKIASNGNITFSSNVATWNEGMGRGNFIKFNNTVAINGLGGAVWVNETDLQLNTALFYNNTAKDGGSVYAAENSELTFHGSLTIRSSTATLNGGGVYLNNSLLRLSSTTDIASSTAHLKGSAMHLYKSEVNVSGKITVHDCFAFQSNDVLEGTMYLGSSIATFSGQTTFLNNSAFEGGAVYALESTMRMTNYTNMAGNRASLNGGGLYLDRSRIALLDVAILQSNTARIQGGGLYGSIGSVVFLSGEATYKGNSAREGGVFALENGSFMIFSSPLNLKAIENSANVSGGVVFYTDVISTTDCANRLHSLNPAPVCFLELNSTLPFNKSHLNISLNFTQNTAGQAGAVLYGGNLERCRMLVSEVLDLQVENRCEIITDSYYINKPIQIIWLITTLTPIANSTTSIFSSAPLQICFCENGLQPSRECSRPKPISVRRGETFKLSAVTVGQALGSVPSTIRTDIDSSIEINTLQRTQKTSKVCTDIFYRLFTTRDSLTLVLYPDGPCRDTGIARTEVQVSLLPCPDGFMLSPSKTECICEDRLLRLNATCNIDERTIEVSGGIWLKAVYDINDAYTGLALHRNCPFDYCVSFPVNMTLENPNILCNHHRTGSLCGSCKTGYSLALGSFHCLKCSNYYLLLLIPFALVGILLVVFLHALDLTVAKGTVNGLILYANIVQANKAVFLSQKESNILTVFIAWLNLDLGIESCFFDGLSAYTHTWLQFAFPLYVWLLVSLIAILSHKSRTVSKWLGMNPVAVLATLLLMSYAKVLRTIISALSRTYLETPTGFQAVWTYDGNVRYFKSTHHVALALVAICALIMLFLPYSFLLMFGWKLQNHSDKRIFSWINRIKPFMDTIYGPFRKEARYWTGLLLVTRCVLFLIFTFNGLTPNTSSSISVNLLAITSVFVGLAVLAWLNGGIYDASGTDLLEAAYMVNITLFAAATYHVRVTGGDQATLAHISIAAAFVLFIGIILFHVYLRVRNRTAWKRLHIELTLSRWYQRVKKVFHKNEDNKDMEVTEKASQEMSPKTEEPTVSYVTLREPLLEPDIHA